MVEKSFDKEKFINHCCPSCNKGRAIFLEKIEQYRQSDPEMVTWLEEYRDRLWRDEVKKEEFRKLIRSRTDEQLKKDTATALRAMADKVEEGGMHFMIGCELPKLPIFSGEDDVERYYSNISVSMVAGPLGG